VATLYDDVIARVPGQTLANLTRQKATVPVTYDATVLQRACDDVEFSEFVTNAQQTYDATNRQHVTVAVAGVLYVLRSWLPQTPEALDKDREAWLAACERLRMVTSRDVVTPTSVQGGGVDASEDPTIDTFDTRRFRDLIPNPPTVGETDDGDD